MANADEGVMVRRRTKWERDEVLAKIRAWNDEHGSPPTASDWQPSDCRRSARISAVRSLAWLARAARAEAAEAPWPVTVIRLFGSWNAAIAAAGLEPRPANAPLVLPAVADDQLPDAYRAVGRARGAEQRREALIALAQLALAIAEQIPEETT